MRFAFLGEVLSLSPTSIITLKHVAPGDDYLEDHFETFPVLPGVLMLECMVQAARKLAQSRPDLDPAAPPLVLGRVRALKYGRFVRPGADLRVEVSLIHDPRDNTWDFKGEGVVIEPRAGAEPAVAVSGRFSLRPARVSGPAHL